jgi:fibronectin-binding autotransporter adhesin
MLLIAASTASAQTSGTLATDTSTNYSTAAWNITSGTGTYPTGGGTAEFDTVTDTSLTSAVPGVTTITLDVSPTLSGLTFNSPFTYNIAASGSNTLNLSTSGATINAELTLASTPTLFSFGDTISAPITGGGTSGLSITGGGVVSLTGTNTYTGGTTISGGSTLGLTTASDAALGATGTGNGVTLNNGNLLVYNSTAATAMTTARNFTLGTGGGNFELFNSLTISGTISGGGALNFTDLSGGTLTLTGANTYTGATNANGPLVLSGASGAIASSSSYTFGSELTLDSSATGANNSNRLSSTAALTFNGTYLVVNGNSAAATNQAVGATTLGSGNTFTAITPSTAKATSFTFSSLARSYNATLSLTGTSLGATPGADVATVLSTTAPTLVGGGGAAGSTTISIVPWATGNTTANNVGGTSFVTYSNTAGFRPLTTSEYATAISGTTQNNVLVSANTAVPSGGATVNSVLITKTGTPLTSTSGIVLTVTSGALMYSPATSDANGTVSANLNFGTAEGVITSTTYNASGTNGTLTLSGNIAGSGGVTLNPINGGLITLSGANTYTGTTTLLAGYALFSGTIANTGTTPGIFGEDTSAIVMNPGGAFAFMEATAATTFNRNLLVVGSGSGEAAFGYGGSGVVTMNGNISLQRSLTLYGGSSAALSMVVNGVISGSGSIIDQAATYITLNGNNTFSGGTNIQTSTYTLGSSTAFGTGPVYFSGAGTIQGAGTSALTIANNLFLSATATLAGTAPLNFTGTVNLNGSQSVSVTNTAATTFSGVVSNGALTKTGAGALTLSGANTYTGSTVISAGSVLVTNTSGSGTGTGSVVVNASGTLLGGTGTIGGPVSVVSGAILEGGVGTATGALTLNSSLTLATGSIIELTLGTSGASSSLARTGSGTWTFASAQKFTLLSATPGTYDDIITGLAADPGSESAWTFTNTLDKGTFSYDGAGDIDLTITAVPEPATILGGVFATGLLAWSSRRRRRGLRPLERR